jgi:steroid 5-alpha reductase family enzyme
MTALVLLVTLLITGAALLVLQGLTFLVALKVGKHSVVDTAWGVGIALAALVSFLVSGWLTTGGHGDATRRALLLTASVLWGLRLAAYVGRRNHGQPEDPRYADMLRGRTNLYALRMVYLLQAAILWLATVPVQLGMLERPAVGPLAVVGPVVGTVLFGVGFAFESAGDWQLARFKANPAHRGQIMDRGLWRYTRHPNYFGDFCMWWGLFAISAGSWRELVARPGPLLMSFILTRGTGARMTDRRITASRPQYADYVARTSGFIPLPPKRAPKRVPKRSAAAAAPGERA